MKSKLMWAVAATAIVAALPAEAQQFTTYDLPNSTLHLYQTGDVMGDASIIVEGKKSIVIIEQPLFNANIEEFGEYVKGLNKPVDCVFASYHQGGLTPYAKEKIVMPKSMIEFSKSPMSQGMIAKFKSNFGDSADLEPFGKVVGVSLPSKQKWAGVEFVLTPGVASDFPAASALIDGAAYYMHFAPSISHASPMVVRSVAAIDYLLDELRAVEASGAKYIFGSHGAPATREELTFQIAYLEKLKAVRATSSNPDTFAQRMLIAYPSLGGYENLRPLAAKLYPDFVADPVKEEVRARMQDYLNMVSGLDMEIAKGLWAENDEAISIITPRSHFIGFDSIMNDFLVKAFSSFKSRKLSSVSEVINVYGDSAQVQLYWMFDTVNAAGEAKRGRGRETLAFEKICGEWRLVHVHYSPLPAAH
ncbi:MAG: nuclear transport factor 2 family protein [Rikenellaceae bacterium]